MNKRKKISFWKFVSSFALVGAIIPILITWGWEPIEELLKLKETGLSFRFYQLGLMLWPSGIFMLAAKTPELFPELMSYSTGINIILYSIIGTLAWLGIYKYRIVLLLLAALIVSFWWQLLSL